VKDGGDQFLKQWKIPERSTDGKKRRLGWQGKVQAGRQAGRAVGKEW